MMMVMLMKTITAAMIPLPIEFRCHQERGGEVLPLASGGAGVPPGAIIITAIFTNNFTAIITNSPPSMQRCNLSRTRYNIYLNMVLNAIYYFPMMYGYPMMFE